MNYVIADIHGEITKLEFLIEYILLSDRSPYFVFIGDYIDKGENSDETLRYLLELNAKYSCVFLYGNHEYYWMNTPLYEDYLIKYGGIKTAESFNSTSMKDTQRKMLEKYDSFFSMLQKYTIIQNYIIVHSGIRPDDYDKKIESIELKHLLFNRYDFLKNQRLYLNKYKVIFGHTGFYSPYIDPFKIGIDTSACYLKEQPLTAFCIEKEEFISSDMMITKIHSYSPNVSPVIPHVKPYRM
jgi:serine/threonine protein phosphatase 1